MDGNLVNGLTFMSSFTNTHKDGVGAMVYAPNVGGTQINFYLATCHVQNESFAGSSLPAKAKVLRTNGATDGHTLL